MVGGEEYRAPEWVEPVHYDLLFEPDLNSFTFKVVEKLDLNIKKPTKSVRLNAKDLQIKKAKIGNQVVKRVESDDETVTLHFDKEVVGEVRLLIEAVGVINDKLVGWYRSKYGDGKFLATTQMEAPHARRAFPCFDEPGKKATFTISFLIDKNLTAITNTPQISETIKDGKKLVKFEKTPKMSTYLVYLGVGEFEWVEDYHNSVRIRVVTVPGKKEQGRYALDLAKKFLKYYEDYFNIPYPLLKLDLIAVPDFAWGAMENWGAIVFREVRLLTTDKTSIEAKKALAVTLAHEFVHLWFGDLVTPAWWNDLWLNESFATFMAYKAVDHYFPEWRIWEDFVQRGQFSLVEDSLSTTHPIEVKVRTPNEVEELFDRISYGKGGCILRMIEEYLGVENFRRGVQNYLKKYSYQNATSTDLWNSLAKASDQPVKEIMESWITQPGYPIISAELNKNKLLLKQELFSTVKSDKKWLIPLTIIYSINGTDEKFKTVLMKDEELVVEFEEEPVWFKINKGEAGFYVVKYDENSLNKIKELVRNKKLSQFDRWGVQNSLFQAAWLRKNVHLTDYLEFLTAYEDEDNHLVLQDIYLKVRKVHLYFSQQQGWEEVWGFIKNLVKKPYEKILTKFGTSPESGESQEVSELRSLAYAVLGFLGDEKVVSDAFKKFERIKTVHPDLRSAVLLSVARNGGEKVFNKLMELYDQVESSEEKVEIINAHGYYTNPNLLINTLEFYFSPKVRKQDLYIGFRHLASNPSARSVLFEWVKKNWSKVKEHEETMPIFSTILESLITHYTSDKEGEIRELLKTVKGYKKVIKNSFEKMRVNTEWVKENFELLRDYCKQ